MATSIRSSEMKEMPCAVPCGTWPAFESLEETLRKARRAVSGARHATEDFAAGASLEVRRHPLTAVGVAATAGILTGGLIGLAAAVLITRRG